MNTNMSSASKKTFYIQVVDISSQNKENNVAAISNALDNSGRGKDMDYAYGQRVLQVIHCYIQ